MAHEAAKVLDTLGVGYVLLHGGLPGKERKAVLERFSTDPACKVFLSTDAGGTGLNLQTADTVVNLELPWNPAVLEQRIARVHRMGQNRAVRVINFVTRGTIEEKVLRTVEAKLALFEGLFTGDADEIPFEAVNTGGFLDAMRDLVGGESGQWAVDSRQTEQTKPQRGKTRQEEASSSLPTVHCPLSTAVWHGIAQIVEGACAVLTDPTAGQQLPPEIRDRLLAALRSVASTLSTNSLN